MSGRIFVAGDVHLGAANADVNAFNSFLDALAAEHDSGDQLVLLGDVVDLVRRDPFGCAWEVSETVTRMKRLADEVPVSFVLGNHDTYLRNLDSTLYAVDFREQLVLTSGDRDIRFCHGMEFDRFQSEWLSNYLSGPGDRGDIDPTNGAKDPFVAKGRKLVHKEKHRLRSVYRSVRGLEASSATAYPRRERRAHAFLDTIAEDKLVYGHTHTPYVHADNVAANPGSWKSTAPLHNTFLVIEDGDIALYRHEETGLGRELSETDVVAVAPGYSRN
ncbi:MAG: metallophosphoesterase [Halobacteriota archaeon]